MSQKNRNDEIRKQRELRRTNGKKAKINKKKTPRKKEKKKGLSVAIIIGLMIALVLTVLSLTVFFKASNVRVEGESRYETKQIIEAADISSSQNMILLNKSKVEERITGTLPYIGEVEVKINLLTSTVTLIVSETEPFGAVRYGEEYLLIDSNGKFIEQIKTPTCTRIYVNKIETPKLGKKLVFAEQDDLNSLIHLVKTLEKLSVKEITAIDISNPSDVRLLYKDMQIWKLGTRAVLSLDEELEYKIKFCIKQSESEEGKQGVVDVSTMTLKDETKYGYFHEEVVIPEEFGAIPVSEEESSAIESSQAESSDETESSTETSEESSEQSENYEDEDGDEDTYEEENEEENWEEEYENNL